MPRRGGNESTPRRTAIPPLDDRGGRALGDGRVCGLCILEEHGRLLSPELVRGLRPCESLMQFARTHEPAWRSADVVGSANALIHEGLTAFRRTAGLMRHRRGLLSSRLPVRLACATTAAAPPRCPGQPD